jgi:hypothetical protein
VLWSSLSSVRLINGNDKWLLLKSFAVPIIGNFRTTMFVVETLKLIDSTIMHICLQIAEILTKIFASYDDDKESIKALYSLTLVCKTFHEPALDALWRFQRSFVTLLKMFPKDAWIEAEDPEVAVSPLSQYQ